MLTYPVLNRWRPINQAIGKPWSPAPLPHISLGQEARPAKQGISWQKVGIGGVLITIGLSNPFTSKKMGKLPSPLIDLLIPAGFIIGGALLAYSGFTD
jgi:hypothetical protein